MRILVCRLGAWGDCIIITPLIKYLKEQGNEVYVLTSELIGMQVFANNPHIDKLIPYVKDTVPGDKLGEFFNAVKEAYECDKIVDMNESIECSLLYMEHLPHYNLPKPERIARCNKNVYDYAFVHAGYDVTACTGRGGLYFTPQEEAWARNFLSKSKAKKRFIILWGVAGSGLNKAYPPVTIMPRAIVEQYRDAVIVLMGDARASMIGEQSPHLKHNRIFNLCGRTDLRQAMILTKYANLVIGPDTGLLHSAGCFDTPKIIMLGHCLKEHISKYFVNDYSIEADCDCAPCYKLINNPAIQCPIDPMTTGTWCMTRGFKPERVEAHIKSVIEEYYYGDRKTDGDRQIIVAGNLEGIGIACA